MIKDKDGSVLTESSDIKGRWKQYCEELYEQDTRINAAPDISAVYINEPEILISKVTAALKKMKDNKSPGIDDIPAQLLKQLNGILVLDSNEYYIEPISVHANYRSEGGVPHALYKRSWLSLPNDINDDLLVSYDDTWTKNEHLPPGTRKLEVHIVLFVFSVRDLAKLLMFGVKASAP
eukprot:gene15501-6760_t